MTAKERLTMAIRGVPAAISSVPARVNDWLGTLPSTNARIVVTLICVLGTAVRYWWNTTPAWEPSASWLTFLIAMSGIDVAQFATKRKTQHNPTPPAGTEQK